MLTGDFLRTVDHLIIAGTGVLDDFGVRTWNMPYDLFKWCQAARRVRTRLSFVSVGAGPILHPASRWLMVEALRQAQYRSYRDQLSRDYLAGVGFFDQSDQVFPDLAFSLPGRHERGCSPVAPRPQTIGVGVMGYYGWRNSHRHGAHIYAEYVAKIGRFIAWLLEQGYSVHLLTGEIPTDQRPVQDVMQYLQSTVSAEACSRALHAGNQRARRRVGGHRRYRPGRRHTLPQRHFCAAAWPASAVAGIQQEKRCPPG